MRITDLTDFELEFVKRKHEGWVRVYRKINETVLARTIANEERFIHNIQEEIDRRTKLKRKP